MGWEYHGGRRYYYRKVRKGRRVFSLYEGAGMSGAMSEAQHARDREGRAAARARLREDVEQEDRVDALIDMAGLAVRSAERGALRAAGYHQHKRQWRLRRGANRGAQGG